MIDEGPSDEDIEQLDFDTGRCPHCGAEIWDQAEICPRCHEYVGGNTTNHLPIQKWFQKRWMLLIVIALLVAMGLTWVLCRPAGF